MAYAFTWGLTDLLHPWFWVKVIAGILFIVLFFSVVKFVRVPAVTVIPAEWFWGTPIILQSGLKVFIKFAMNIREFEWTTKTSAKTETKKLKSLDLRPTEMNTSEEAIHSDSGRSKTACTVIFEVFNPRQAIFGANDAPNMLDDKIRSSLRDIASRETFNAFSARNKGEVADDVLNLLNNKISLLGLRILSLDITSVEPIGDTKKFMETTLRAKTEADARILVAKARQRETEIDNRSVYLIARHENVSMEEAEVTFQQRMDKRSQQKAAENGGLVIASPGANVSVSPDRQKRNDSPKGKNIEWENFDDEDDDEEEGNP